MDMGRRPELQSDEFCDANVMVIEIISHLCLKPLKTSGAVIGGAIRHRVQV